MTKTLHTLFSAAALIIATSTFSTAQATNMSMKSCGGGGMVNKKIHGCSDFGHHRSHHMMKHAHHMMKKY